MVPMQKVESGTARHLEMTLCFVLDGADQLFRVLPCEHREHALPLSIFSAAQTKPRTIPIHVCFSDHDMSVDHRRSRSFCSIRWIGMELSANGDARDFHTNIISTVPKEPELVDVHSVFSLLEDRTKLPIPQQNWKRK